MNKIDRIGNQPLLVVLDSAPPYNLVDWLMTVSEDNALVRAALLVLFWALTNLSCANASPVA
jgi:hypothetical protein